MLILGILAIALLATIWSFQMGLSSPVLRLGSWCSGVLSVLCVLAVALICKVNRSRIQGHGAGTDEDAQRSNRTAGWDNAPGKSSKFLVSYAADISLPVTATKNPFQDGHFGIRRFQPDDADSLHAAARESVQELCRWMV